MALTREERKLLHQKSQQPTFGSGKPDSREGSDGDISFRKVEGSGTVQYLKENNDWTAISSTGEMPVMRIGGGSSGGGSSGVSNHASLSGLESDDHDIYLLIDGSRAMTGDLSLGGGDGALTFTVAGENSIKIPDNQASALIIEEANTAYLTFVTTNSGEKMQFHKALDIDAVSDFGSNSMTNVNIDSGAIDGTAIGASSQAAGDFTAIGAVAAGTIVGTTIDATTDFTIGTTVITDDSIVMTPSTSDTITISGATNGALSIVTVDNAAAAANIQITADGTAELAGTTVTLDSSGDITLSAAGYQINMNDASTTRYTFNVDATPKLDVTGAFTIDGSSTIRLDSVSDMDFLVNGREKLKFDTSGHAYFHAYTQTLFNDYPINILASNNHLTSGEADFQQNYSWLGEHSVSPAYNTSFGT